MKRVKEYFFYLAIYTVVVTILLGIAWILTRDYIKSKAIMMVQQNAPMQTTITIDTHHLSKAVQSAQEGGLVLPEEGEKYGWMSCERIGLSAPVYYGDDEKILSIGLGQYANETLPGYGGVHLIGGHDTTYFQCLSEILEQDIIELSVNSIEYQYQVVGTKVIKSSQFSIEEPEDCDDQIILYTCYPIGDTVGARDKRLFVYCNRIE